MHMADALLSPSVGATFWAASLGAIGFASRRLRERLDERLVPLMGVLAAFVFASQMINFTIPGTGSSGHLGGGLLLAVVLGPYAGFIAMASVLSVQALFFADGGLLALGCNIWNLGAYSCFIAYPLIYRPIAGRAPGKRRIFVASIVSAVAALQMGAFSVVLETLFSGRSELPFGTFLMFMQPVHLAIGIVEGIVTAGVVGYVSHARPEIIDGASGQSAPGAGVSVRNLIAVFLLLAAVTGGGLSWFASENPDGLEWSIERVYGRPDLPEQQGAASALKNIQEKTALLPDYGFRETPGGQASVEAGRTLSGIAGAAIVLGLVLALGLGIRALRDRGGRRA